MRWGLGRGRILAVIYPNGNYETVIRSAAAAPLAGEERRIPSGSLMICVHCRSGDKTAFCPILCENTCIRISR